MLNLVGRGYGTIDRQEHINIQLTIYYVSQSSLTLIKNWKYVMPTTNLQTQSLREHFG
jgi:hypothetical protein